MNHLPTLTLLTPTFDRDLGRFLLQRESIERCGIDVPHIAVVDTEDAHLFRDLPFEKNLTVLTSEEVLGRAMDRRRTVWGISRRDFRYWVTGKGVHGWMAQQLMKLAVAEKVGTDAYVCLDSDTFFVGRVTAADFTAADGRVHLYETTDDLDVEMAEWYAHSLRFLGVKEVGVGLRRFTHSPVPMHRGVVRDMLTHIEKLHGRGWMDAMVGGDRITEYATYGAYARHVDGLKRTAPVTPGLCHYCWWASDAERLEEAAAKVLAGGKKMVLVNSNIGKSIDVCRAVAEQCWAAAEQVAA